MKKILTMVLCLALALSAAGCGNEIPDSELSRIVGEAILSDNSGSYLKGECVGEGHRILGSRASAGQLKVYALTMYGNYGFQNDMFVKVSGSGVIPAVLTFETNGAENKLIEIEYPLDGAGYTESIKRMFPLKYRSAALNGENAFNELKEQEQSYAAKYLQSIGRRAEIGEFGDLKVVLLTDVGISIDVSNRLSCDKNLGSYPFWIGSEEYLDNGIRYVRSLSYDKEAGQIIFCTVEKETDLITERFVFDAATGAPISAG